MVLGFELTIIWLWASSFNHKTRTPASIALLPMAPRLLSSHQKKSLIEELLRTAKSFPYDHLFSFRHFFTEYLSDASWDQMIVTKKFIIPGPRWWSSGQSFVERSEFDYC